MLWKRELINQTKREELKFMALEKEWLLKTAEKFYKEEETVAEKNYLHN